MKPSEDRQLREDIALRRDLRNGEVKSSWAWLIFSGAAILEVGGDAVIRKGLRRNGLLPLLIGFVMLGFYGMVVNTVKWDFSKLLGVYVGVFALISLLFGRFVFQEKISAATGRD